MLDLLNMLAMPVGVCFSLGYFIFADFTVHRVAGDNEAASHWLLGLFMAVYALLILLVYAWL